MKISPKFTRQDGLYLIPTVYFIRTWTTRWLVVAAFLDFRLELHFIKTV
jgi:hypothetical protein